MTPDRRIETVRLAESIRERRECGVVHVAFYTFDEGETVEPGDVMEATDLAPVAEVELTPEDALTAAREVLAKDLAHRAKVMPAEIAEALAKAFVATVPKPARYFTNGELLVAQAQGLSGTWRSASTATFDSGLVIVGKTGAALLWIEDED